MTFHVPEKYRITKGPQASTPDYENNGAFLIELSRGQKCFVIASDGEGWEHVSVSRTDRCLTWEEMCMVKSMFWSDDDCVIQYHPPKSEYVNNHPYCLHLWRPVGIELPTPPSIFVGI